MACVKRIDAFLAQPERAVPPERETAVRGDIVLSHVTFVYGEKPVLLALRRASEGRTVLSISHRLYENLGGRTVKIRGTETA